MKLTLQTALASIALAGCAAISAEPQATAASSREMKVAFDITTGIQPTTFPTVFAQNPNVTTWSGKTAPFGYMDWWPHSLYVNTRSGPTADADVRWAISKYIDRDQIVDFGWAGAASTAALPLPPSVGPIAGKKLSPSRPAVSQSITSTGDGRLYLACSGVNKVAVADPHSR